MDPSPRKLLRLVTHHSTTAIYDRSDPDDKVDTFPFLELPKDLRLEVHQRLLIPEALRIYSECSLALRSNGRRAGGNVDKSKDSATYYGNHQLHWPDREWLHPAILCTSKQVYVEPICTLYRPNTLNIRLAIERKSPRYLEWKDRHYPADEDILLGAPSRNYTT